MHTHDIKEIRNIKGKFHEGHFQPGSNFIVSLTKTDWEVIDEAVKKQYFSTLRYNIPKVKFELNIIYKKPFFIMENEVGNLVSDIKDIIRISDKSIAEVVEDIKLYLGYRCTFYRYKEGRYQPVELERIKKAYIAIQNKESFANIENILYF